MADEGLLWHSAMTFFACLLLLVLDLLTALGNFDFCDWLVDVLEILDCDSFCVEVGSIDVGSVLLA